ncbi:hypothetical protein [Leisingera sp. F5]|uniref:hypothetical protein n=1 Tax=Leisingera sp. F5 TaxID=1813816 RepID=UPI000B1890D7|nr:hypothetical protein [Leisingera sp. F5]
MNLPNMFSGVKITVSDQAYKMVPIYPDKPKSKRRLRRTRGKFGRTDRMLPLAFKTPFGLVVHPRIYSEMRQSGAILNN